VITTRRSLLVSLGLALPVAAVASGTAAASTIAHAHHARKHGHIAHGPRHGKAHRTALSARPHAKHA